MPNLMEIHFLHPRDSHAYDAEVAPECTSKRALTGLQSPETGPFLDPAPNGRPYELVLARNSMVITPDMTMAQAGVVDGEVVEVRQSGQGA